jgi:hypothetical protein
MPLACRLFGHRPSRAISGETGDVRSRCARCGTSLVMYGRGDWRGVEIAHQRFSLRRLLARLSQDWRCRRQRHRPAGDFSRWINDAEGGGYHLDRCSHCDTALVKPPGKAWRPVPPSGLG